MGNGAPKLFLCLQIATKRYYKSKEQFLKRLTQLNPNFKHNSISHWLPSLQKQSDNQALFEQAKNKGTLDIAERVTGQAVNKYKGTVIDL